MAHVHLVFFASDSLLSRLIRWVSRSQYSHVGISFGGYLYEALARGVVRREGEEALQRCGQAVAWALVEVSEEDRIQMRRWLDRQVGRSYSVMGFLAAGLAQLTGFRVIVSIDRQFICSGLVATALQIAGYDFPTDPRLVTPGELAEQFTTVQVRK
jgi:cell wall-associated NlpC family hydrolase